MLVRTIQIFVVLMGTLLFLANTQAQSPQGQQAVSGARVLKYEEPKYLTANIYGNDRDMQTPLYTFKRLAHRSGSTLDVEREFNYPDGKAAARERAVYEGDRLRRYELNELQIEAEGSAEIDLSTTSQSGGQIRFEYKERGQTKAKVRVEALEENTLIADMVGPFLVAHWEALARGQWVKCRYIVIPRSETVGFTFRRESESTLDGRPVIIVRMEATSRIIAMLVDPLFFTLEKADPHRVLRYFGRTTPKMKAAGKWKDLDALTVFDWNSAQ